LVTDSGDNFLCAESVIDFDVAVGVVAVAFGNASCGIEQDGDAAALVMDGNIAVRAQFNSNRRIGRGAMKG